MWSGLMIFLLDESKASDKGFGVALTVVVILTNTILLICFVVQFVRAKLHERKEAARLAASKPKLKKNNFFSASFSALRQRFGSSGGDVELTSYENPMQDKGVKNEIKKKKRDSKMKKVRKKLSIGARVKRNSHGQSGGGGGGGLVGGEVKTVSDVENVVSMHVDEETGRRYSYNKATGQTQWLSDDDGDDGTTIVEE